jgi:adenylate cyclase
LLLNDWEGNVYAYIGLKVIAKYLNSNVEKKGDRILVGDYTIPVNPYNEMLINFAGPSGTFPIISFYKVWQLARQGQTDFFKRNFKDKIVLIGPGNIYSQDFKPTPFYRSQYYSGTRQTPGIEIIANVINTILERRFIISLRLWQTILIILFLGVLTSFVSFNLSPITGGIVAFAVAVSYVGFCMFLFSRYNLCLDMICPLDTIPLTYTAVFTYRYTIEDKEKRRIKSIFKHYVSEEVVEELLKYPGEIPLGGNRVEVTVLFADIRGFTAFSEKRDPRQVVSILNSYFAMMADIILKNKGTLDKYIGDGILAFFGAPIVRVEHAELAVHSAIEMVSMLDVLNKELMLDVPLRIGIGIHSGEAVVGNIGSTRKMEYTIIGDTVNTASRVEGMTKELQANILITEETFSQLKILDNITPEKEIILRGKTQPIKLYRVET